MPVPTRLDGKPHSLSARLSHVLVAHAIEFDNEFEHRSPHRTTISGRRHGVWLTSLVMWYNCMRYAGDQPLSAAELTRLARTKTNLNGMERWGYLTIDPAPPRMIRATAKGLQAREVWRPLSGVIEQRWEDRFGADAVGKLRLALSTIVNQLKLDLPDCLPILHYGLFSPGPDRMRPAPVEADLSLATLLSRALLDFAMTFEKEWPLSLAICANVLRVLDERGVRVRDLPIMSGVSKESIAMALGVLSKKLLVAVEKDPAVRAPVARLTPSGLKAQTKSLGRLDSVEQSWRERFGKQAVSALYQALQPFTGELLFRGIEPYPDGWRASVRRPTVLPDYPMVLHRGGYPDGS